MMLASWKGYHYAHEHCKKGIADHIGCAGADRRHRHHLRLHHAGPHLAGLAGRSGRNRTVGAERLAFAGRRAHAGGRRFEP